MCVAEGVIRWDVYHNPPKTNANANIVAVFISSTQATSWYNRPRLLLIQLPDLSGTGPSRRRRCCLTGASRKRFRSTSGLRSAGNSTQHCSHAVIILRTAFQAVKTRDPCSRIVRAAGPPYEYSYSLPYPIVLMFVFFTSC